MFSEVFYQPSKTSPKISVQHYVFMGLDKNVWCDDFRICTDSTAFISSFDLHFFNSKKI